MKNIKGFLFPVIFAIVVAGGIADFSQAQSPKRVLPSGAVVLSFNGQSLVNIQVSYVLADSADSRLHTEIRLESEDMSPSVNGAASALVQTIISEINSKEGL